VKYYQAADAAALQQAFQDIVVGVASCTFNLTTVPANPNLVVGYINGNPVANSLIDGFTYDAATQSVTFHGLSCLMIQNLPGTKSPSSTAARQRHLNGRGAAQGEVLSWASSACSAASSSAAPRKTTRPFRSTTRVQGRCAVQRVGELELLVDELA